MEEIDYIFKKRTKCPAIRYEPERKVQADSDRSDIRVFETGVYPLNNMEITGKAQEMQRKRNALA